jgi:hypothetical protein
MTNAAATIRALNDPQTKANVLAKVREGLFQHPAFEVLLPSQKRAIAADLEDPPVCIYDTGALEIVVAHIGDMGPSVDFPDLRVYIVHEKGTSDLAANMIWSSVSAKG